MWASVKIYLQVMYQSDQFLDKNKDYVVPEHQDLLSASNCPFVAGLFPPLPEETSKSSKFSSIGSRFKVVLLLFSYCFSLPEIWYLMKARVYPYSCEYCNSFFFFFLVLYVRLMFHDVNDAATITTINGYIELYRTALHQMCETKQPTKTCSLWECQYHATIALWCEYIFWYYMLFSGSFGLAYGEGWYQIIVISFLFGYYWLLSL